MNRDSVCVVVLDHEGCRLSASMNEDMATTLIAVAGEDPADWSEMIAYWPRYTTCVVPEFASSLPMEIVDRQQMMRSIGETEFWIVLDLVQKRFLSGKAFQTITRDACFAMDVDEQGEQHDPLSIHFAPWWELHEQVDPSEVDRQRESLIAVPIVDRDFLFGEPLFRNLAKRILSFAGTERGRTAINSQNHKDLYPLTIEVHRDWLMTPQEQLGGGIPRQMLHGGVEWIDKLIWGHRLRFERGGGKMVAAPTHVRGYANGPMGGEEMAIYFDLCRELISSGWFWCGKEVSQLQTDQDSASDVNPNQWVDPLVDFLRDVKTEWMNAPMEGGSPPAFILECSRRRIPRGAGVEIVGMDERETEHHMIDCDCPICQMMADGSFGISFTGIDGHHLELDDEFAFSMCETREAWDEKQREYARFSAECDRKEKVRERKIAAGELDEADEVASVWSGQVSDNPLPGDSRGYLKLAFLLAEVVSELQFDGDSNAETIKRLNCDFSAFRMCAIEEQADAAKTLIATLETIAESHPSLVPRVADFQSRIEETLRTQVSTLDDCDTDYDDGFPF